MVRVLLLIMESIGAEGVVGFFGGLILILGFIKLSFGGVICCRKTKAQEYADRQKEKGAVPKGMCSRRSLAWICCLYLIVQQISNSYMYSNS